MHFYPLISTQTTRCTIAIADRYREGYHHRSSIGTIPPGSIAHHNGNDDGSATYAAWPSSDENDISCRPASAKRLGNAAHPEGGDTQLAAHVIDHANTRRRIRCSRWDHAVGHHRIEAQNIVGSAVDRLPIPIRTQRFIGRSRSGGTSGYPDIMLRMSCPDEERIAVPGGGDYSMRAAMLFRVEQSIDPMPMHPGGWIHRTIPGTLPGTIPEHRYRRRHSMQHRGVYGYHTPGVQ